MEDSNRFSTEGLWERGLEFHLDSIPKQSSWSTVGSRSIADQDLLGVCVCVEVLRPSQPNGVMSSAVSLPNHTFTGQA